jgi:hypothetical protein
MQQTRDEITENLTERLCWEVARRDETRIARRLYRKPVVDRVYRLDKGALLDDFLHLLQAYVYPAHMRATRDLLRRRMYLTRKRAELLAHIQNTNSQYNLPEIGKQLPAFSAKYPPGHARETGRKSFPGAALRVDGGVRSAR